VVIIAFSCCLLPRGHRHGALKSTLPEQPTLPLPGADERCPRCGGKGDTYYLHHADAEVVGGRRIVCQACDGTGVVRVPAVGVRPDLMICLLRRLALHINTRRRALAGECTPARLSIDLPVGQTTAGDLKVQTIICRASIGCNGDTNKLAHEFV